MPLVKKPGNGKRYAHLQAKISDNRKNKPILDFLEEVDRRNEGYEQKDLIYKGLHMLAHRWGKDWGMSFEQEPEDYIMKIMRLLNRLIENQDKMADMISRLRAGTISSDEFNKQADNYQRQHEETKESFNVLSGASSYSSGWFELEEDDE